jgi:hypothetical protein
MLSQGTSMRFGSVDMTWLVIGDNGSPINKTM